MQRSSRKRRRSEVFPTAELEDPRASKRARLTLEGEIIEKFADPKDDIPKKPLLKKLLQIRLNMRQPVSEREQYRIIYLRYNSIDDFTQPKMSIADIAR